MHRQAWNIAGLNEDDPWRELLKIADPVERSAVASKTGFPLTEADLSSVTSRRWLRDPLKHSVPRFRCVSTRAALLQAHRGDRGGDTCQPAFACFASTCDDSQGLREGTAKVPGSRITMLWTRRLGSPKIDR